MLAIKQVSSQNIIQWIISSLCRPSLRRRDTTLQNFYVVLSTFERHLNQFRGGLFQRLKYNGISETLLVGNMHLYESILSHLRTMSGLSMFINITIKVKQGYSLSPTLFKIYIDDLKSFIQEHSALRMVASVNMSLYPSYSSPTMWSPQLLIQSASRDSQTPQLSFVIFNSWRSTLVKPRL